MTRLSQSLLARGKKSMSLLHKLRRTDGVEKGMLRDHILTWGKIFTPTSGDLEITPT